MNNQLTLPITQPTTAKEKENLYWQKVFSDKKEADLYHKYRGEDMDGIEVDAPYLEREKLLNGFTKFNVDVYNDGSCELAGHPADIEDTPNDIRLWWKRGTDKEVYLNVMCWTKDEQEAFKIAKDIRVKIVELGLWDLDKFNEYRKAGGTIQ